MADLQEVYGYTFASDYVIKDSLYYIINNKLTSYFRKVEKTTASLAKSNINGNFITTLKTLNYVSPTFISTIAGKTIEEHVQWKVIIDDLNENYPDIVKVIIEKY